MFTLEFNRDCLSYAVKKKPPRQDQVIIKTKSTEKKDEEGDNISKQTGNDNTSNSSSLPTSPDNQYHNDNPEKM